MRMNWKRWRVFSHQTILRSIAFSCVLDSMEFIDRRIVLDIMEPLSDGQIIYFNWKLGLRFPCFVYLSRKFVG